jgi:hypothetical protein
VSVIKLEASRKVFADDFAPYLSEFRKRTESLPKTAAGAPFDDTIVYYDVHGMGGEVEGFLVSFLQASRCHRGLADVAFSNSQEPRRRRVPPIALIGTSCIGWKRSSRVHLMSEEDSSVPVTVGCLPPL